MAVRMNDVWRAGLRYEPSERWVRAYRGDELVVDSRRPVVVWAEGRTVPIEGLVAFWNERVDLMDAAV
jgi:uncharacterized protein (DUF427 family)